MDTSKLRLQLRQHINCLSGLFKPAFGRERIFPAALYVHRFRCGKPTCHCAGGEPHSRLVLSIWRNTNKKTVCSAPSAHQEVLRRHTEAYRQLRQTRAKFRLWSKRTLQLLDKLEQARTVSLSDLGVKEQNPSEKEQL